MLNVECSSAFNIQHSAFLVSSQSEVSLDPRQERPLFFFHLSGVQGVEIVTALHDFGGDGVDQFGLLLQDRLERLLPDLQATTSVSATTSAVRVSPVSSAISPN